MFQPRPLSVQRPGTSICLRNIAARVSRFNSHGAGSACTISAMKRA
jgi:hypothetical protein